MSSLQPNRDEGMFFHSNTTPILNMVLVSDSRPGGTFRFQLGPSRPDALACIHHKIVWVAENIIRFVVAISPDHRPSTVPASKRGKAVATGDRQVRLTADH